jgi:hypothetical protein
VKCEKKLALIDGSRLSGVNRRYSMGQPVLSESQIHMVKRHEQKVERGEGVGWLMRII